MAPARPAFAIVRKWAAFRSRELFLSAVGYRICWFPVICCRRFLETGEIVVQASRLRAGGTPAPQIQRIHMAKSGSRKKLPREVAVINADNCTGCEASLEVCPVDCIYKVQGETIPILQS